jgi:hypothetical protein
MIRTIRTSLDRFDPDPVESTALMYHAYMMTDAFLWCHRDTFTEKFRIADTQLPTWLIRFTPDIIREWTRKLMRPASVYRLR